MSLFNVLGISASAMQAQSQRINVLSSNMANAETAQAPGGQPYRARHVVFESLLADSLARQSGNAGGDAAGSAGGVRVASVQEDASTPLQVRHEPGHPYADARGYVTYTNVNPVVEMVDLIAASRSYQNALEAMNVAKTLLNRTLQMGQ